MQTVKKTDENMQKCTCPSCPSYNDCAKGKEEGLYCAPEVGASTCEIEQKGCVCGACPVHEEHELQGGYFCTEGAPQDSAAGE